MNIIGVTGRAGAGKDTFCTMAQEILRSQGKTAAIIACAQPLKEICQRIYGTAYNLPEACFYGTQEEKNASLEDYGLPGWSGRKILQYIGTEGFRTVHPNVWAQYMYKHAAALAASHTVVLISDVRFLSEAQILQKNKSIIVRMKRPEADDDAVNQGIKGHASEVELAAIREDYVIDNQGGPLHNLRNLVEGLLCQLGFLHSTPKLRV